MQPSVLHVTMTWAGAMRFTFLPVAAAANETSWDEASCTASVGAQAYIEVWDPCCAPNVKPFSTRKSELPCLNVICVHLNVHVQCGSKSVSDVLKTPYFLAHRTSCIFTLNYKSSSEDEIANVNVLRRHRTRRGQSLRPLN